MRVLLIEDDQIIGRNVKTGFSRLHIDVDLTSTYEDGLFMAETETYDALIVDWSLPDGEGLNLISQLRSKGVDTPTLILTARSQLDDKITGLNVGT